MRAKMINNIKIEGEIIAHQTSKLNAAHWNSSEFCLKILLLIYKRILNVLETISSDI